MKFKIIIMKLTKMILIWRHNINHYPHTVNYKCKCQSKNEHELPKYFLMELLKEIKEMMDIIIYIEQDHSKECNSLSKKVEKSQNIIRGI